jgi:Tol biopolymer transport system component
MKKTMIIFCLAILFVLIGCGSESSVKPSNEETSFSLRMSRETIPEVVNSIQAQISNGDDAVFTVDFDMDSDPVEAEFTDLQLGTWNLTVSAFDAGDNLVFLGETEVQITHGMNYANVEMNPVSGNLIVNLTWNEDEPIEDNYILVYSEYATHNNIYRYHIETNEFIQITTQGNAKYPEFDKNNNKILYQDNSNYNLFSMDINGNDIISEGEFTYGAIDPAYNENTNLFYYYVFSNGFRKIIIENCDTHQIMLELGSDSYHNMRPKPSFDGNSFYYISDRTGLFQIYKYDLTTNSEIQLTSGNYTHGQPCLNSDENGFYMKELETRSILYYDIESGETSVVLENLECENFHFIASPDGQYFALNMHVNNQRNLYLYDNESNTLQQISESGLFWDMPVWVTM